MRKQLFYSVVVLLNTCSYFHSSSASPSPQNTKVFDKINGDYLCESRYYDREMVERSYKTGCFNLWNDDSKKRFPAKLEDDYFVNGAHKTLFSWPLNYAVDNFDLRYPGIYRTVFDINCRFHGVMMHRESNHEDCIKLSERKDIDSFVVNLEEYEIHKCERAVFGQTYLQASVKAGCKAILYSSHKRYPSRYGEVASKTIYKWPLYLNNAIHGTLDGKSHIHLKHFVLYTHEGGPVRVIERVKNYWQDCLLEKKIIELSAYNSNVMGFQEYTIYDDKKSYDCSGQVFTDKYVQETFSTMKGELADRSKISSRRNKYPKLEDLGSKITVHVVWIWYLRVREEDFLKSKRYVLAADKRFETFNVFHVEKGKYTACIPRYKQTTSMTENSTSGHGLNIEFPDDGQCNYSSEGRCEKYLPDPKRRKILSLDSQNTEGSFENSG